MSISRQSIQLPEEPQVLPEQVVTNLSHADMHCRRYLELSGEATALGSQIETTQAALDKMKARHRILGIEAPEQDKLARAYHEIALDHCKKYGYGPMPAPFDELVEHLKRQLERIGPAEVTVSDTRTGPLALPSPLDDPNHQVA